MAFSLLFKWGNGSLVHITGLTSPAPPTSSALYLNYPARLLLPPVSLQLHLLVCFLCLCGSHLPGSKKSMSSVLPDPKACWLLEITDPQNSCTFIMWKVTFYSRIISSFQVSPQPWAQLFQSEPYDFRFRPHHCLHEECMTYKYRLWSQISWVRLMVLPFTDR